MPLKLPGKFKTPEPVGRFTQLHTPRSPCSLDSSPIEPFSPDFFSIDTVRDWLTNLPYNTVNPALDDTDAIVAYIYRVSDYRRSAWADRDLQIPLDVRLTLYLRWSSSVLDYFQRRKTLGFAQYACLVRRVLDIGLSEIVAADTQSRPIPGFSSPLMHKQQLESTTSTEHRVISLPPWVPTTAGDDDAINGSLPTIPTASLRATRDELVADDDTATCTTMSEQPPAFGYSSPAASTSAPSRRLWFDADSAAASSPSLDIKDHADNTLLGAPSETDGMTTATPSSSSAVKRDSILAPAQVPEPGLSASPSTNDAGRTADLAHAMPSALLGHLPPIRYPRPGKFGPVFIPHGWTEREAARERYANKVYGTDALGHKLRNPPSDTSSSAPTASPPTLASSAGPARPRPRPYSRGPGSEEEAQVQPVKKRKPRAQPFGPIPTPGRSARMSTGGRPPKKQNPTVPEAVTAADTALGSDKKLGSTCDQNPGPSSTSTSSASTSALGRALTPSSSSFQPPSSWAKIPHYPGTSFYKGINAGPFVANPDDDSDGEGTFKLMTPSRKRKRNARTPRW